MNTRIIGFGNSILTDDGVGIYAAREVSRRLAIAGLDSTVDIVETEVAGFALMELMTGWKRVILVDSIQFDGVEPGTVIRIEPDDLHTSLRIAVGARYRSADRAGIGPPAGTSNAGET